MKVLPPASPYLCHSSALLGGFDVSPVSSVHPRPVYGCGVDAGAKAPSSKLSSLPVTPTRKSSTAARSAAQQHSSPQAARRPAYPPQTIFSGLGLGSRPLSTCRAAAAMNTAADLPPHAAPHGGTPSTNTTTTTAAANTTSDLSQVLQALQAIYASSSSNDTRRAATEYLEQAKRHPEAPSHGYSLARDRAQPAQLRHYGLTMLEYSIKYTWDDFSPDQALALRGYVVGLAQNMAESDPVYLRNKVAQLWTEIAKRSWGAEWLDMDEQLVALWTTSLHHQAVVLYVLETLSEEVFNREDATAGLRGSELGRACVDIFTPLAVVHEQLPTRDQGVDVRCGDEGWLRRLCDNLNWCLGQDYQNQDSFRTCALKTMNALRAAMPWIIPKAIAATQVIEAVCKALAVPVVELQLVRPEPTTIVIHRALTKAGLRRSPPGHLHPPPPPRR
jgi:exportin-5